MLDSRGSRAGQMTANSSEQRKPRPGAALFQYHRWAAIRRTEMLEDLANLHDDALEKFWKRWGKEYLRSNSDRALISYRDELRQIWSHPISYKLDADTLVNVTQARWMLETRERATWRLWAGCVFPDFRLLPLSLAVAVGELAPKMAICANPECPQRYFLKGRSKQRFCDRPACILYGQQEHKRKWWSEHGKEWKQKRQRDHKRQSKAIKQKKIRDAHGERGRALRTKPGTSPVPPSRGG